MSFTKSTWLWEAEKITVESSAEEILYFCLVNGVDTIYLHLSNPAKSGQPLDSHYRAFIRKATELNISVHAAMGDATWYHTDNYHYLQEKLDRLVVYQATATNEELFTGVHFDIEPHTLGATWENNKLDIIEKWFAVVGTYTQFIADELQLTTSAALPLSMGKDALAFVGTYMLEAHDYVVVMAYRNFAKGGNSISEFANNYLTLANALEKPNSVEVAVETKPLSQANLFFTDKRTLYRQAEIVEYMLKKQSFIQRHGNTLSEILDGFGLLV